MTNDADNASGATRASGSDLLLRVWTEQYRIAKHYITDRQKRGESRDRFRAEGVAFMVLSLKDQLSSLLEDTAQRSALESDYRTITDLLAHI